MIRSGAFLFVVGCLMVKNTDAACTIPDVFQSSTWVDNVKGDIVFTTWKMSGWDIQAGSKILTDWEVVDDVQFEDEDKGHLALRAVETFNYTDTVTGTTTEFYSFLCLKFKRVDNIIYRYDIMHDFEPRANNERVLLWENDHLTRLDQICDPSFVPSLAEFGVLVKKNQTPIQQCPNAVLGRFTYTVTMPDASKHCDNASSLWEGCRDNRRMTFNLTKCAFPVAYSAGGDLTCVTNIEVDGGHTYILVHNNDATVDDVNTFRFACVVAKDDGTAVSVAPRGCQPNQDPTSIPTDRFGNKVGYTLVNEELTHCRTSPPGGGGDDDGLSVPEIVGVTLGGVVGLVIIVIVVICVCRFKRR